MKVDKRFSHGLTGTLAYTFSKMLSDGVGFTTAGGGVLRQDLARREKFLYPTDQPKHPYDELQLCSAVPSSLGGRLVAERSWRLLDRLPDSGVLTARIRTASPLTAIASEYVGRTCSWVSNSNFDPNANFYLNKAAFSTTCSVDIRQRAGLSLHTAAELPERIFWNLQRHKDS